MRRSTAVLQGCHKTELTSVSFCDTTGSYTRKFFITIVPFSAWLVNWLWVLKNYEGFQWKRKALHYCHILYNPVSSKYYTAWQKLKPNAGHQDYNRSLKNRLAVANNTATRLSQYPDFQTKNWVGKAERYGCCIIQSSDPVAVCTNSLLISGTSKPT